VNSSKVKVLVDTTYLLPILGVEVEGVEEALKALRELYVKGRIKLLYSPFSLLEAIGKISRAKYDARRVNEGITSIMDSGVFKAALPGPKAYVEALELRRRGFKDLIDLLLYLTAKQYGARFLTRDRELAEFLEREGRDLSVIMREEELSSL